MQLQQEVNDAMGGFGRSVAEVKKCMCRESQTKGKEAPLKRPNGSSEVKTRGGIIMHGN